MFSVDNFYQYLMHSYSWPRKNNFLHIFDTHGSRDIYDLTLIHPSTEEFYNEVRNTKLERFYGGIFMFDQEPFELNQLELNQSNPKLAAKDRSYQKSFSKKELIYQRLSTVYTPIICHSEANSNEMQDLENHGFITVHYWWHGLIARDWYRHWKHYVPYTSSTNRLGCYIRDTSGTREYRKDLLSLIKDESIYCPLLNGAEYSSDASAMLEWSDTSKFNIQIVAETLFDTSKTHLTEKVLKPIAMEQPFILFAGPHSLEYMQRYGFQTFACCWDESYDKIENSQERYYAVAELIKNLNNLPQHKYNRILERAKMIAQNNKEHFYSQKFEDIMLDELHSSMSQALELQQAQFYTNSGGLFFKTVNQLRNHSGEVPTRYYNEAVYILKHIQDKYPTVAKQILKQYPDLF